MANWRSFSLRGLLVFAGCLGVLCAGVAYLYQEVQYGRGIGPYKGPDDWPRSLAKLIGGEAALQSDVEPYGLVGFLDHRSIWRISAGSPLRGRMFDRYTLVPTTQEHPKAHELIASMPSRWGPPGKREYKWFATPGYGGKHIEGMDLFLVAEDQGTGELIVLHEWVF